MSKRAGASCSETRVVLIAGLLLAAVALLVLSPDPPVARAAASGDDYPSQWRNIPMDSVFDSWGEYNRECTSAVAWWLHERNGFEMPFHDNANGWGHDASVRGFAVNGTPAVGSVAWWGPGDHVAWVAAVNGGSVTIEEYNYDFQGHYHERTIPAGSPSGYIHFKDLGGGGSSWPPAEGSFVSHSGFVYRIAGGAPIYVSSWGAVGGPQPSTPLSDGQFASLPQFPRDGTILDSSGGGVFIAAGGAPLYLSNWNAIGGPKPGVGIDGAAIDHAGDGVPWDHLRPYPADGTILGSSAGGVFIAAGGAPLYLSNWNAIGGPKPSVGIDQWDIDHAGDNPAAHLRPYPADGTLVGTSGDGRVYEIVGGAPLYVSTWAAIGGPRPATGIDQWDVNHTDNRAAHLRQYPADGTFINTSTGRVYRIAGGAPFYVSKWSVFGGVQPYVSMDQWDVDNASDPHAHLRPTPLDGTVVKGLPSNQYWGFSAGLRSPVAASPRSVAVDDAGLAAFPQKTIPAAATLHPQRKHHRRRGRHRGRRHHRHRRSHHRHRRRRSEARLRPAIVPASSLFGPLQGPSSVRPGAKVRFVARDMTPSRRALLTIQLSACVGGNGCAVGVRGPWRSNRNGVAKLSFHFPLRYGFGCTAVGCESHPRFEKGSQAQVQVCVAGPTETGEPGHSCDLKTVRIAARG